MNAPMQFLEKIVNNTPAVALAAALAIAPLAAFADGRPAAGDKALLEIVVELERLGYGPITDISFDDGGWEVEAVKGGESFELWVDPQTGKVVSEHRDDDDDRLPPANAKPLSEILRAVGNAGFAPILEASYERNYWEVEAVQNGVKRELRVDAQTGEILANRVDR